MSRGNSGSERSAEDRDRSAAYRAAVKHRPTTCDADARPHPFLDPLLESLRADDTLEPSFADSRYRQGLVGANRFLRIRRS